jgi:hypothetical protein
MTAKILHLPLDVGGNFQQVSRGMQRMGIESKTLVLEAGKYHYSSDMALAESSDKRLKRELMRFYSFRFLFSFQIYCFNGGRTIFTPITPILSQHILKRSLIKVYNFLLSFMQHLEILILRLRKCKLVMTYQGDDARQGLSLLMRSEKRLGNLSGYYDRVSDNFKANQISFIAKKFDLIYALNPDLLEILPPASKFLPYATSLTFFPTAQIHRERNETLVLGHAPTNRDAKGTQFIVEAVRSLQEEGLDLTLMLIENKPHIEALEIYASVDVMIDQLLSGWYGALSVECMLLGKPVICYLDASDMHRISPAMATEIPIIRTTVEQIKDTIRSIYLMPRDTMCELGKKHKEFALKWHSPDSVAKQIIEDIENLYR